MLSDGMNVDPQYQVQVLSNKIAQAAIREAQLEAAVQQLLVENQDLRNTPDKQPVEQEG
jgi:hypothetical protein